MRHTILGAGGAIGNPLTVELIKNNEKVRLVSRSGFSVPGTETVKADLLSFEDTVMAVQGSDIVYLLAGLQYNHKIWAVQWPVIMKNVIEACKRAGAKLIFLDNVYMYGKVEGKMTEKTPYNPCSKKGEVRAKIATMLEEEMKQNNLKAIIARAADFYGPYANKTSMPYILAIDKIMNGKKAQWMISVNKTHSFSYTLDCAEALFLLSQNDKSYNQVWHLPTFNPAIDGKTFIEIIANETGGRSDYMILSKFMLKLAGIFDNVIAEIYEMAYQNEFEYYFDSTKFNTYFNYSPKSYRKGIHETIEFIKQNQV